MKSFSIGDMLDIRWEKCVRAYALWIVSRMDYPGLNHPAGTIETAKKFASYINGKEDTPS